MIYFKYFITAAGLLFLIFTGCGASEGKESQGTVTVKISKIDSWLNLMPGGPSSFHIAGEVIFTNISGEAIDKISMEEILVYQDKKLIYKISPFLEAVPMGEDLIIKAGSVKTFLFGTRPGLEISKELDADKNISAVMKFTADEAVIEKAADSIKIEKAY